MDVLPSARPALKSHTRPEAKRRRLRKGTFSCWECKRRKMRCVFDPLVGARSCDGCRRRGSPCIGQEFPEQYSSATGQAHDIDHGPEATHGVIGGDGSTGDYGIPTPPSTTSQLSPSLIYHATCELIRSSGQYEGLSKFLHQSLPSKEMIDKLRRAHCHPLLLPHEVMTTPYKVLEQSGLKTFEECLSEIPALDAHPVLIARYMLLFATLLQHLHPDTQEEMYDLPETPQVMMKRLVEVATSLVTTNDDLLDSIEALECVIIESAYYSNRGNLRRGWVSCRRAMSMAQLMGLDRQGSHTQFEVLDPQTPKHPAFIWFRIVALDRLLCLMLGLSQGSMDRHMASEGELANDDAIGRLERIHCKVASEILQRNISPLTFESFTMSQAMDAELRQATKSLPRKWWLIPRLNAASSDSQSLFWDTRRLFAQMMHYNLVNQLHLPYMIQSPYFEKSGCDYCRTTCANASREMVSRFAVLRSFNGTTQTCRIIDFLTMMAALTLLLVHIHSRQLGEGKLLYNQYHSDRALMEEVQENMDDVNRFNSDALSEQCADLLRQLLKIDADTVDADPSDIRSIISVPEMEGQTNTNSTQSSHDDSALTFHVPYFGTIKITHKATHMDAPTLPYSMISIEQPTYFQATGQPTVNEQVIFPPELQLPPPTNSISGDSLSNMEMSFFEDLLRP